MKKGLWLSALAALAVTVLILGFGVFRPQANEHEPEMTQVTEEPPAATQGSAPATAQPEMEEPTTTPDAEVIEDDPTDPFAGLPEEEYEELLRILDEISERERPFALAEYAAWRTDDLVKLMGRIGEYADACGLTPLQLRGLLFARESLDAASAEGYAALLKKCYDCAPMDFLRAWHDAGEPKYLMYEITGVSDPDSCYNWLHDQWQIWVNTPDADPEP